MLYGYVYNDVRRIVMNITFRKFTENDVESCTDIMKAAFDEDSDLFRTIPDAPPGYDDGSFLRKNGLDSGADSYCIYVNQELAGAVIIFCNPNKNENFLGCIFLNPVFRGKGIGTSVWKKIEKMYPDVKVWRTETPLCSKRNLNFYINKLGFMAYKITDPMDYESAQVQLIKHL